MTRNRLRWNLFEQLQLTEVTHEVTDGIGEGDDKVAEIAETVNLADMILTSPNVRGSKHINVSR